jgi:hypothetical protein
VAAGNYFCIRFIQKILYQRFSTTVESKINGLVVQLVRIPACHAGGRGFESRPDRIKPSMKIEGFLHFIQDTLPSTFRSLAQQDIFVLIKIIRTINFHNFTTYRMYKLYISSMKEQSIRDFPI